MKICILITEFLPDVVGGAEISVYNSSKLLVRRGHEVHILTRKNKSSLSEIMDGIHIHRIPFSDDGLYTFEMLKFFSIAARIIGSLRPDIFHIHYFKLNGVPGVFLGKVFGVPSVVTDHCGIYCTSSFFNTTSGKFILYNANAVIALTKNLKIVFNSIFERSDIAIVPNGFDNSRFGQQNSNSNRNTGSSKTEHTQIKYLFVGRIAKQKKIDRLIEAFHISHRSNNCLRMDIVGKGPELQKMIALSISKGLQKHIKFHGFISDEDLKNLYLSSDVYIQTSDFEGLPVVIMEAYGSGLPFIITDFPGGDEIVEDGINGFVVPKDPHKIAEKMLVLANDKELRQEMSKNNLEKSKEFTYEKMVDKLENVYFSILKR